MSAGVEGQAATIVAPAEIGVYVVAGLALEWRERLAAGGAGTPGIDLSAVAELDGAGLQLLVAARRAGARLDAPSPAVCAAADRFGLGHLIEPTGEIQ